MLRILTKPVRITLNGTKAGNQAGIGINGIGEVRTGGQRHAKWIQWSCLHNKRCGAVILPRITISRIGILRLKSNRDDKGLHSRNNWQIKN